jgi:hypothetical protein
MKPKGKSCANGRTALLIEHMLYRDYIGGKIDMASPAVNIYSPKQLLAIISAKDAEGRRCVSFGFKPMGYSEEMGAQVQQVLAIMEDSETPILVGVVDSDRFPSLPNPGTLNIIF